MLFIYYHLRVCIIRDRYILHHKWKNPITHSMSKDHKQKLTFVLFCSGNGADSTIYRPSGDDKRYRHRQDALVRCVAATLFSAAGASKYGVELILLYDGDLSCRR